MNREAQIKRIADRLAASAKELHDGMQSRVHRCADKADWRVVFEIELTKSLEGWQHEDLEEEHGSAAAG